MAKQCSDCKQVLDGSNFHKKSSSKDGLQSKCKACNIKHVSKSYAKDRQRRIEYQSAWDVENKHRRRINTIVRKYGVDRLEAERLESIRTCAICEVELDEKTRHVDHCHESGSVRGVLCMSCNIGLGLFKDNTTTLKKAIDYLKLNMPS